MPAPPIRDDGMLETIVTYLEMLSPPTSPPPPPPAEPIALLRAEQPTVSFYRFLYNSVGEPWFWWIRKGMDDDKLLSNITDPKVEIEVLYVRGVPAGYFELDRRIADEVELAYFGLMPEFVGRRLGPYLLRAAIDQAWTLQSPKRMWLHTCDLDSPKALATYQRAGFVPYKQENERSPDPRLEGQI